MIIAWHIVDKKLPAMRREMGALGKSGMSVEYYDTHLRALISEAYRLGAALHVGEQGELFNENSSVGDNE